MNILSGKLQLRTRPNTPYLGTLTLPGRDLTVFGNLPGDFTTNLPDSVTVLTNFLPKGLNGNPVEIGYLNVNQYIPQIGPRGPLIGAFGPDGCAQAIIPPLDEMFLASSSSGESTSSDNMPVEDFETKNHLFIPFVLGDTICYYAFEDPDIASRYYQFLRERTEAGDEGVGVAIDSTVYWENFFGIFMTKSVRLVQLNQVGNALKAVAYFDPTTGQTTEVIQPVRQLQLNPIKDILKELQV